MAQAIVNKYLSQGVPGDRANLNPAVYTTINKLVGEGQTVKCASFVWENEDGTWQNSGTGTPAGFVERVQDHYLIAWTNAYSFTAPEFSRITVGRRGDYWAVSTTTPAKGQTVYASTTDGTLQTAAAGAAPSGTVDTGFVVHELAEDDPNKFVMSSWDKTIAASPAP